jgi:hypothetical protein
MTYKDVICGDNNISNNISDEEWPLQKLFGNVTK